MSASKFNRKARERLLYIATALVILVTLSIITWVIPHVLSDTTPGASPDRAVPAFWVITALHLLILGLLTGSILVSRRGRRLRKIFLVIPGIILFVMSMLMLDAAEAYLGHQPGMFSTATILFFGAFSDMMAGVIMIMLPTRFPDHPRNTFSGHPKIEFNDRISDNNDINQNH